MELSAAQRAAWHRDGYLLINGAIERPAVQALHHRALALADQIESGSAPAGPYAVIESCLDAPDAALTDKLSKIFRVHRAVPAFRDFTFRPEVIGWLTGLLGPDLDCFLSQFIFKLPGALGQPWHQDAFYFPFSPPSPRGDLGEAQVGLWVAVTDARPDNGPLWVLPGSHREPVHPAARDPRTHANPAYVEIQNHDFSAAIPVLMQAGDALLFHSRLMHKSTDNLSQELRAAMVYHYAPAGTVDHSTERFGRPMPNVDWMVLVRDGVGQGF